MTPVCFSGSVLTFPWQIVFFNQHGCTASAANAKYNSRAAQLYREKIKTLATQATRRHGTEVKKKNTCMFLHTLTHSSSWVIKYNSLSCVPLNHCLSLLCKNIPIVALITKSALLLLFPLAVAWQSSSSLSNITRWQTGGFLQSAFTGKGVCFPYLLICLLDIHTVTGD